jgi:hypothetical protein
MIQLSADRQGRFPGLEMGEVLDEVLAPLGILSFCENVKGTGSTPTNWSIPFENSMRSARQIASGFGLQLVQVNPESVLVGNPGFVETMPFVYFTFPLKTGGFTGLTASGVPVAEVVKWLPQARVWGQIQDRWAAVGVGYAPLDDGTDDWIAVVWNGEWQGMRPAIARLVRFRIAERFGRPWPDCIWSADVLGDPVLEFDEDLDGDGVRDIVLNGVTDVHSRILSGASGGILATFAGGTVVVSDQRGEASSVPLIAVRRVPEVYTGDRHAILRFDAERREMIVLNSRADEDRLDIADGTATSNITKNPTERILAECARNGGEVEGSRVYELRAGSAQVAPSGTRVVLPAGSNFERLADAIGNDPIWFVDLARREGWLNIVFLYDPRPKSE